MSELKFVGNCHISWRQTMSGFVSRTICRTLSIFPVRLLTFQVINLMRRFSGVSLLAYM